MFIFFIILFLGICEIHDYYRPLWLYQNVNAVKFSESDLLHIPWINNAYLNHKLKEKRVIAYVFHFDLYGLEFPKDELNQIVTEPMKISKIVQCLLSLVGTDEKDILGRENMMYIIYEDKKGMIIPFSIDMNKQLFYGHKWNSWKLFTLYTDIYGVEFLREYDKKVKMGNQLSGKSKK